MTTEEYSIGYDAGYQDGFNKALEEPLKQEPWKCACGANLYINIDGEPTSRLQPVKQEPVAFMFKVKRTTKAITVLDEFASVDYFPQDDEEIVSKEPLIHAAPVSAKREWVDLTDDEEYELAKQSAGGGSRRWYRLQGEE